MYATSSSDSRASSGMPVALLANIKTSYVLPAPSKLLALLDRILFFSLENKSTSCRVWARGVEVSNPDAAVCTFVEIGGGETGLDVIVCL